MTRTVRINVDTRYYGGLGDVALLCWLPVTICTTDAKKAELARLFNRPVDSDKTDAIDISEVYRTELRDQGRKPRIEYIKQFLGIEQHQQPTNCVTPKQHDHQVMLFPQTHWNPREWGAAYWIDLAYKLKDIGLNPVVVLENKDERYLNVPFYIWGHSISDVGGMMLNTKIVIGNDSFPVHLAGNLNVKALALLGPTKPTVFCQKSIIPVQSGMACTGCHFAKPLYRPACDQFCQSLYAISVDEVLKKVQEQYESEISGTVIRSAVGVAWGVG